MYLQKLFTLADLKSCIEGEFYSYGYDFIVKDRLSFKLFESMNICRNCQL